MLDRTPEPPPAVSEAFARFPETARARLLAARAQVFAAATDDPRVGELTETLKWGEPAYLTEATGSGSTLRLGLAGEPARAALLVNCRTGLVEEMRARYGDLFSYAGTRGVLLSDASPPEAVRHCAVLALTWHARRRERP